MYKIIFKGQIGDEFVDTFQGQSLSTDWKNNTLPSKVEINGNLYESSAIKAVISGFSAPDRSEKSDEMHKMISDMWSDEKVGVKQLLSLSPEKRAENTEFASMIFTAHGVHMDSKTRGEVVKLQTEFFKENPEFAIAKPTVYKHLLPSTPMYKPNQAQSLADLLPINTLHFAERAISAALANR